MFIIALSVLVQFSPMMATTRMLSILTIYIYLIVFMFNTRTAQGQPSQTTQTSTEDTTTTTDNSTASTLGDNKMKILQCHVCSYYPNVKWEVNETCQETIQDDQFLRNCSDPDIKMVMPKAATQYRCRTTIGKGIGDKLFYIRGCAASKRNYGEETQDFDLATTKYCVPNKCNGSMESICTRNNFYFIVILILIVQSL